jgi:hypothetical protein
MSGLWPEAVGQKPSVLTLRRLPSRFCSRYIGIARAVGDGCGSAIGTSGSSSRWRTLSICGCTSTAVRMRPAPAIQRPYRPEAEGRLALPKHEFGLDVIALIGTLRYQEHQSVPEIHRTARAAGEWR